MEDFKGENERILLIKISHLQEEIKEKAEVIDNYESQFKKLYEDFNYNVELIYERDRDIQILNEKLEEKVKIINKQHFEIQELNEQLTRLNELERENYFLNKKLDSILSEKSRSSRVELRAPRLDYRTIISNKSQSMKKTSSFHSNLNQKPSLRSDSSFEQTSHHVNELNFDLESRIKALEMENDTKTRKSSSLCNSKALESSVELDSEVQDARSKVKKQEKEISELIKSLQVYKKQNDLSSKTKLKVYDDQIVALNEDIKRLKQDDAQLEEKKIKSVIRPRSTIDKRIN